MFVDLSLFASLNVFETELIVECVVGYLPVGSGVTENGLTTRVHKFVTFCLFAHPVWSCLGCQKWITNQMKFRSKEPHCTSRASCLSLTKRNSFFLFVLPRTHAHTLMTSGKQTRWSSLAALKFWNGVFFSVCWQTACDFSRFTLHTFLFLTGSSPMCAQQAVFARPILYTKWDDHMQASWEN